ncbi:MAG: hypothetical protein N6V49_04250, partial [Serratia symbiotica]|nr:hypothetical protein [Serratia symbiotica]
EQFFQLSDTDICIPFASLRCHLDRLIGARSTEWRFQDHHTHRHIGVGQHQRHTQHGQKNPCRLSNPTSNLPLYSSPAFG